MDRSAPGPHGGKGAAPRLGLARGEPYGTRAAGRIAYSHHNPAKGSPKVTLLASDDDDRAHGTSRHREADRPQQQPGDLAAPTNARDQGERLGPRPKQRGHRIGGHYVGGHFHLGIAKPGAFRAGGDDVLRHDLSGGTIGAEGGPDSFVTLPEGGMDEPQWQSVAGRFVHCPVDRQQTGFRSVDAHDQREFHRGHRLPSRC